MLQECISVGAVDEGDIQEFGILKSLLHSITNGMIVVLRFNDRNWNIRFVVEQIICLLGFTPLCRLAVYDHPSLCEIDLFAKLCHDIPLGTVDAKQGGRDELRTDICFCEALLVYGLTHRIGSVPSFTM